jgi:hypothetical protein
MTTCVSTFIAELRRDVGDIPQRHEDRLTGDGSSTVYKTKFSPIVEGSYAVYVNNALKTEGLANDFTLDLDTGDLVLTAATSNEIRIQYKSAAFRDAWWLSMIQGGIQKWGDKFYRTTIRSLTGMSLSANVDVIKAPSDSIRLTEVLQSADYTSAGSFVPLGMNHAYDRRSNSLVLGLKPSRANYLSVSYLRRVAIPTTTASNLDIEDNWKELLGASCKEDFARNRALQLSQQGNASVEEGHLSVQGMRLLANDMHLLYRELKQQLKPVMPSYAIPYYIPNGGFVGNP